MSDLKFSLKQFIFLFMLLSLSACQESGGDVAKTKVKSLYQAIYKNDTAKLNIQDDGKAFEGQLEINYNGLYSDSGLVYGVIKGDTLRGTYEYKHYGIEKKERIPIALLKKNSELIMGVGQMEIYFNILFFKKTVPIDYKNVKFTFKKR